MLLQELSGKDQERVAEVSRVRVELQEQIGHLHAERTAQGALKEKISALEREIKGVSSLFLYFIILHKSFYPFAKVHFDKSVSLLLCLCVIYSSAK